MRYAIESLINMRETLTVEKGGHTLYTNSKPMPLKEYRVEYW